MSPREELQELIKTLSDNEVVSVKKLLSDWLEQREDEEEFDRISEQVLRENLNAYKRLAQ